MCRFGMTEGVSKIASHLPSGDHESECASIVHNLTGGIDVCSAGKWMCNVSSAPLRDMVASVRCRLVARRTGRSSRLGPVDVVFISGISSALPLESVQTFALPNSQVTRS